MRNGTVDLTIPNFAPKTSRLPGVAIIATPLLFEQLGYVVNRKIYKTTLRLGWLRVFDPVIWCLILIWRSTLVILPSLKRSTRQRLIRSPLGTFLSLFAFFAHVLYAKSFLRFRLSSTDPPFTNQLEASRYLSSHSESRVVFSEYVPGRVDQSLFPALTLQILANDHDMIHRIISDPASFTIGSYEYLLVLLHMHKVTQHLQAFPETTASYVVSFCRKDYAHRERITLAFDILNESGGVKLLSTQWLQRKRRGRANPEPLGLYLLEHSFWAWLRTAVTCVTFLLIENVAGNTDKLRLIFHSWKTAAGSIPSQMVWRFSSLLHYDK